MVKKKRVRVRDLYGPFAGFRQGSAIVAQDVVVVDCVETIVRSEGCIKWIGAVEVEGKVFNQGDCEMVRAKGTEMSEKKLEVRMWKQGVKWH